MMGARAIWQDHRDILTSDVIAVVQRNIGEEFTLSELQCALEMHLDIDLDKRNFRAAVAREELVEAICGAYRLGCHRPAQLYRFRQGRNKAPK